MFEKISYTVKPILINLNKSYLYLFLFNLKSTIILVYLDAFLYASDDVMECITRIQDYSTFHQIERYLNYISSI